MKGKNPPCFKQVKPQSWALNTRDDKFIRQKEGRITILIALFLKEISFLERVFETFLFLALARIDKTNPFFPPKTK